MLIDRRSLLAGAATAIGFADRSMAASAAANTETRARPVKAIAFDGFPIIDPRPIAV